MNSYFSVELDLNNLSEVSKVVKSCLGTKMIAKWMDKAVGIAIDAVRTVVVEDNGRKDIDIKRYVRVEMVCR